MKFAETRELIPIPLFCDGHHNLEVAQFTSTDRPQVYTKGREPLFLREVAMTITLMKQTSQAAKAGRLRPQNCNELRGDYHLPFAKTEVRIEVARRRIIFASLLGLATFFLGQQPAKAYETPWCAVISEGYWDCQYRSIEECRPNVLAGNRGFCNLNPRWSGWYGPGERRPLRY